MLSRNSKISKFDYRNPQDSRMALSAFLLPKLDTQEQISLSTGTLLTGMRLFKNPPAICCIFYTYV